MATKINGALPGQRRKYNEAFKAKMLCQAGWSSSTQAAARQLGIACQLGISPKLPQAALPLTAGPSGRRERPRRGGA